MSYSGYGCSGYMIDWGDIKKIIPQESDELENAFQCFDDLYDMMEDNPEDNSLLVYDKFVRKFNDVTGLQLYIIHIGSESDELSPGIYWGVEGVKDFTPAGLKYKDVLNYERWVEYG